jgi:hypothetical protein
MGWAKKWLHAVVEPGSCCGRQWRAAAAAGGAVAEAEAVAGAAAAE